MSYNFITTTSTTHTQHKERKYKGGGTGKGRSRAPQKDGGAGGAYEEVWGESCSVIETNFCLSMQGRIVVQKPLAALSCLKYNKVKLQ